VVPLWPVPCRLARLRLQRLTAPSWSRLFLGPACERDLAQPAHELCSLVDSPYASLMEPQIRHLLHDTIQTELARQGHYSIRYRLHTAIGALEMIETGQVHQQYGRDLIGGYLVALSPPTGEHSADAPLAGS